MLRRSYELVMASAGRKRASWALAGVAFIESSVFPLPPDVLLIPMVLAQRDRAWRFAAICTVASVLGGILGYVIGYALFEAVAQPILDFYGYMEKFASFQQLYNEWGAWIVFTAGLTPIPYKVFTIASGVTRLDFAVFIIGSVISRGLRFYIVAGLLWYWGEPIRDFIERYLGILTIVFCVFLVGGFVLLKYVM